MEQTGALMSHLADPRRRQIELNGLVTSYLDAGDPSAQPLILLHDGAWGGSAEASWGPLIPALADRYRILAPDLYGYGASSKMVQLDVAPYEFRLRQVAGLLDALGLADRPAHVIGNSFGGAMALRATTLPWFSWRVASAVSIAGTGGPYRTKESLTALAHFDGSHADMLRIVRLLTGDFPSIEDHVSLRLRDASTAAHFRAVSAAGLVTPFSGGTKIEDDYPRILDAVDIPLALVSGRQDTLVEPDWAARIAENSRTCRIYEIDARHSPNISDPADTAVLLLKILRDLENDARTGSLAGA